jgi:hypothetical protein
VGQHMVKHTSQHMVKDRRSFHLRNVSTILFFLLRHRASRRPRACHNTRAKTDSTAIFFLFFYMPYQSSHPSTRPSQSSHHSLSLSTTSSQFNLITSLPNSISRTPGPIAENGFREGGGVGLVPNFFYFSVVGLLPNFLFFGRGRGPLPKFFFSAGGAWWAK